MDVNGLLQADEMVTMDDVLKLQQGLEKQAQKIAKQGRFDCCTYDKGYISQPVYACGTCAKKQANPQPSGFCASCSMNCHIDHDVYELFQKRHFRCDCGTEKFAGVCDCELLPKLPDATNDENKYNHNFKGLYCYCNKPYVENTDTMFQCLVCQDWFHGTCADSATPDYEFEFVCRVCVRSKHSLQPYIRQAIIKQAEIKAAESKEDTATTETPKTETSTSTAAATTTTTSKDTKEVKKSPAKARSPQAQEKKSPHRSPKREQMLARNPACKRPSPPSKGIEKDFFLPSVWREAMCTCSDCVADFKREDLEFLLAEDEQDEKKDDSIVDINNVSPAEEEEEQKLEDEFSTEILASKAMEQLPRDQVVGYIEKMRQFNQLVRDGLQRAAESGETVITGDTMKRVLDEAREACASKRRKFE